MARSTPTRLATLALVVLLLAGCSGGKGDASGAPAPLAVTGDAGALNNTTALPALPVTLELAGCLQLHTSFPFPVAVFAQIGFTMPEGFTYDSADGNTVNVLLAWWFCPEGRLNNTPNGPFADVASMIAAMPVRAPAELTAGDTHPVPAQLDLLPLTWVVSEQQAADHLGQIEGLRDGYVVQGEVALANVNQLGAAATYSAYAAASFGVFSVDPVIQPSSGPSEAARYRMWLSSDGARVNGYLDVVNSAGTTLGSGPTDLRFNGDPDAGAPPVTVGTSHVVDATGVVIAYNRVGSA